MKLFVVIFCVVGAMAEPPRFRTARFRSQRIELAPTTTDPTTEATTESGPYPPSGWRPSGQAFTLPQETAATPTDAYGPPDQSGPYPPSGWKPAQPFTLPQEQTPPATSYGVPDNTYGVPATDASTTDNPAAEKLAGPVEVQKSLDLYYVLLPNGELQRVQFLSENDFQNLKNTARLQLRDRAPLLVFGP